MLLLPLTGVAAGCNNKSVKAPNIFFFFADDWGQYAGILDDSPINSAFRTPVFDHFASEGVNFVNAFVNAPSSTPSRSALLSGQYFYRTGLGAILKGEWDGSIPSYPLILRDNGYHIGYSYKVWAPGTPENAPYGGDETKYDAEGYRFNKFSQNVTKLVKKGKSIEDAKREIFKESMDNFRDFIADRPAGEPFCFWFGPRNTHRSWERGSGKALWGLNPDDLKGKMPPFLPDVPEVREDLCDYLGEVLALDTMFGMFLDELDRMGERENTLVVASGDHGIPGFPRGKCNVYPFGTAVALFAQYPAAVKGGRVVDDFINLMDLAPTFLEAAGVEPPSVMTGRSLMPLLMSDKSGVIDTSRNYVVTGRERHLPTAREGNLPYPMRAIQTKDFLYVINFKPDRDPMGAFNYPDSLADPSYNDWLTSTYSAFGDIDNSPTKAWMIEHRFDKKWSLQWNLGFEKRPAEELYDLCSDPYYMVNVASAPAYSEIKAQLRAKLLTVLKDTCDPRVCSDPSPFDIAPYTLTGKQ